MQGFFQQIQPNSDTPEDSEQRKIAVDAYLEFITLKEDLAKDKDNGNEDAKEAYALTMQSIAYYMPYMKKHRSEAVKHAHERFTEEDLAMIDDIRKKQIANQEEVAVAGLLALSEEQLPTPPHTPQSNSSLALKNEIIAILKEYTASWGWKDHRVRVEAYIKVLSEESISLKDVYDFLFEQINPVRYTPATLPVALASTEVNDVSILNRKPGETWMASALKLFHATDDLPPLLTKCLGVFANEKYKDNTEVQDVLNFYKDDYQQQIFDL